MKQNLLYILVFALFLFFIYLLLSNSSLHKNNIDVVDDIEIENYMGKWYSVYETPTYYGIWPFGYNSQECTHTTATYSQNSDGTITVNNCCIYNNNDLCIEGLAGFENDPADGMLWVEFTPPFRSPYLILGISQYYDWAVVGNPHRSSLWILSRQPSISSSDLNLALDIAESQGYNLDNLYEVNHK